MSSPKRVVVVGFLAIALVVAGVLVTQQVQSRRAAARRANLPAEWAVATPEERQGIEKRLRFALSKLEKPANADDRYFALVTIMYATSRGLLILGYRDQIAQEYCAAINVVGEQTLRDTIKLYGFSGDRVQSKAAELALGVLDTWRRQNPK